jgi:ATP-dependent protease ClpP protease subunit
MRSDARGEQYFGLKELAIDANYNQKPGLMDIIKDGDGLAAYLYITGTDSRSFRQASEYLYWHPDLKKLIVELHTGGGSIMDAWRSVGIIKEMQSRGIVVEVRVYGMSASAGVFLLVAGDIGHRFVNPNAEIMIHKIWTFKMFDLKDPDTAEDEAAILKHFQDNIDNFIKSRSKLTLEQLKEATFKKDYWMTGAEAVEFGLADGLIGG